MELCIQNKNLFRVNTPNLELMKNENLNELFNFEQIAFSNGDNLQ